MKILLTFVIVFLLAACAPSPTPPAEPGNPTEPSRAKTVHKLTKADHQAKLAAGDSLEVGLAANPSTGYTWEADGLDSSLLTPSGEPEFRSDNEALVGAGGMMTMRFQALKAGTTTLKLVYHRPWEKDTPPLETFQAEITIQ